jgi:CRP-like cAMP-binding protein
MLTGVWLCPGPVRTPIETLVIELLEPNQQHPVLQRALLEELNRPVKRADVVLEYLGLRQVALDAEGEHPLLLVAPKSGRDPWREALLDPGGACPIGVVVNTCDRGRVALIHEVFVHFSAPQKELIRRYAALAVSGKRHEEIVEALGGGPEGARHSAQLLAGARRQVQIVDPSILFSPDGEIRVQLGSLSQTTRNLLREGLQGEHVFVLPSTLFEGRTNYGDIEFLVYLNFFVRQERRTRIVGTARQRQMLKRLLTLAIFGLFDPDAPEQPSFERLHQAYGVPDRETNAFLRTAYETYAIRGGPDPASPILSLDRYVDFFVLEADETVIPVHKNGEVTTLGEVRVRPHARGGFDVRIVQADGRSAAKRLEVSAPRRVSAVIPRELCRTIQFATDRPRFGVTPLGTSHGFDPDGDLTSFVIWLNGRGILVDPSPEALAHLEVIGVAPVDIPYVFLTHVHADHDGGLVEKLLSGSRTTVIASDPVFRAFIEKAQLITGHDFEGEGLFKHVSANPGAPVAIEVGGEQATLETRWNLHPIPTNGLKVSFGGKTFGYSADTQYNPDLLARLREQGKLSSALYDNLMYFFWTPDGTSRVDLLYHEAGIPPIHTDKEKLRALPEPVKAQTFVVHIADKDVPEGFAPGKPPLFSTHVLLPPTERSREGLLLETLRLVAYLYDIPSETLAELLSGAEVRAYSAEEVIIRKGPVGKDEPLHFYVIADGETAVQDGRRLIATLRKADSFGEWGISHQRGFRAADVVAARPAQCIQFTEAQYWWLVERHPAIEGRISQIRSLLPRLQSAQDRAQLKAEVDASQGRSVIASMTSSQLSAFAIFSEVRAFKAGHPIVVEGEEADGFYILLSGHLTATVDGRMVGELSEGDVFGEMGLLEGGKRGATITVASADAEVLFMSTQNFQNLLEAVPSFSLGIRETAAQRRAISRRRKAGR